MEADPSHPNPIQHRSTFQWNSLLRRAEPHQALTLYSRSMLRSGAAPNKFTFTFLLKACGSAASVRRFVPHLHAHLIKLALASDPFLSSSLISAYARLHQLCTVDSLFASCPCKDTALRTSLVSAYSSCGLPDAARRAFDEIPQPNAVSWAALVSAYARGGRYAEALSAFRKAAADAAPTEAALVSALASSAGLSKARCGACVHGLAVASGRRLSPALGTALLDMYSKCGAVEDSAKVFAEMPERDRAAWTAMISAMAAHGRGEEALGLFGEMLALGLAPDHVTYVGVLHACSHSGLSVDEARRQFERMSSAYGVEARAEHYGCMVDVLGRGGRVAEAWELVRSMPLEPDRHVLASLLRACCSCGRLDWAEWAAGRMARLDAGDAACYVMLANAYAEQGRWEDSARVRGLMRRRGVPKAPGSSAAIC